MELNFDALVVGAGYAGAVAARELAERGGKRVLVLERRDHIGGNAYDRLDEAGRADPPVRPPYFPHQRQAGISTICPASPGGGTTSTGWWPTSRTAEGGRMTYPVPFNLTSLETAFGRGGGEAAGGEADRRLRRGEEGHHSGAAAESGPGDRRPGRLRL